MSNNLIWDVDKETGCITSLKFGSSPNFIYPSGCETGNWRSFFTQEWGGINVEILEKKVEVSDKTVSSRYNIKLKKALIEVTQKDQLEDDILIRNYKLKALEDSYLGDFVIRYVFKSKFFNNTKIADDVLSHRNSNLYYQYPVKKAELFSNDFNVEIKVTKAIVPENMGLFIYVRDEPPDKWVTHIRAFVTKPSNFIFKWSLYRNFTFPEFLTSLLTKSKKFVDFFWLCRETRLPHSPLQLGGNVFIKKGTEIELESLLSIKLGSI